MELLNSFRLTLITLAVTFILPFAYFGYHLKFWYRPDSLKSFDFLLKVASILIAAIVIYKMFTLEGGNFNQVLLTILHLAPLVLTLLIVTQGKNAYLGVPKGLVKERSGTSSSSKAGATPTPQNRDIEKLTWDDLVINEDLKQELVSVIDLLKDPKTSQKYGIDVPKGILFNGPPGTGKTTIAKVVANTAGLSFFVLRADEIISKWVGESEKNLTQLFNAAMKHKPAIIFIDEIDSIGKARSGSSAGHQDNLLNHLLQLIDGVVKTEGLYIIAATNRADLVDSALKRGGRLNKTIEIGLPNMESRYKLFELALSKLNIQDDVDIHLLAQKTKGLSPADIKTICNQAGLNAFKRESGKGNKRNYRVFAEDIMVALDDIINSRG